MSISAKAMPANTETVAAAAPLASAEDLLDELAAFRPIRIVTLESTSGLFGATECQVVKISDDGTPIDLGVRNISWTRLRRQLSRADANFGWIAGRIVRSGRTFKLNPVTRDEAPRVQKAMSVFHELGGIPRAVSGETAAKHRPRGPRSGA